jgi:polyribonucleotide nucleotidyltransferase
MFVMGAFGASHDMQIPNEKVGLIIGRGGSTIREIQVWG